MMCRPTPLPAATFALAAIPFTLAVPEDAEGVGDRPGRGRVSVRGPLEREGGQLALGHARVAALAARGQPGGGDRGQQPPGKRGGRSGVRRPRWKEATARRRMRRVPVKRSRSGSTPARVAASYMVRRTAGWAG